jgi:hypothetical protein
MEREWARPSVRIRLTFFAVGHRAFRYPDILGDTCG